MLHLELTTKEVLSVLSPIFSSEALPIRNAKSLKLKLDQLLPVDYGRFRGFEIKTRIHMSQMPYL
jgi:hypothetical protein